MTSVGYGEVYPRTALGKCLGFTVMLVGMVVIALPVAIVGQKFQDVYECHNMEVAKTAASARLQAPGQIWALVPGSNILEKLEGLKVKDAQVSACVAAMVSTLPEIWEQ